MREQLDDIYFAHGNRALSAAIDHVVQKLFKAMIALNRIQYDAPWAKRQRPLAKAPIACG